MVIGNKVDMAKSDRAVSKEEGKALADEFGAAFLEVSVSHFLYRQLSIYYQSVVDRQKITPRLKMLLRPW